MSTSGTYSNSVVKTAKLINHAVRRCGLNPTSITPEDLGTLTESLRSVLFSMSGAGINLWLLRRIYLGMDTGKYLYPLPEGVQGLLSLSFSRVLLTDPSATGSSATSYYQLIGSDVEVGRFGVRFDTITASETVTVEETTDNGVSWSTVTTITKSDWTPGVAYWFDLPTVKALNGLRVSTAVNPIAVSELYIPSAISDIHVSPFNRDDYMAMPNKHSQSYTPTNFLFEKFITPQILLWPVPRENFNHLTALAQFQVQEVGALSQEIEIPTRWQEAVIWALSEIVSFELPGVDDGRRSQIAMKARQSLNDASSGETDGSPIRIMPNLQGYFR